MPCDASVSDWRDPSVGWGIILADDPALTERERACAYDAPEPIRELLRCRPGATVLRYRPNAPTRARLLWDATNEVDVSLASSPIGVSAGCLPKYLLIYASPSAVPWSIQYALNVTRCVGRLDLSGTSLEHYVSALLSDWAHVPPPADSVVVWATEHEAADATARGRELIAEPFVRRVKRDPSRTKDVIFLDGDERATAGRLVQALRSERPGTIVTSSNGSFDKFEDEHAGRETIGAPVDQNGDLVDFRAALALWDPGGAVWYANASYSAGVDDDAVFEGLVDRESLLGRTISRSVVTAMSAPLANSLLGAKRPLRAFVGHVGPLFAASELAPTEISALTATLVTTLAAATTGKKPIAEIFASEWFNNVPKLYAKFDKHLGEFNANITPASTVIRDLLTVLNVERTVLLGDPTVVAPAAPIDASP